MRLHINVDCLRDTQNTLIRIATSGCKEIDQRSSKTITTRFLKDKIYRLLGIKVQGILYRADELIIQVDSHEKYVIMKKNSHRISSYLKGITRNVKSNLSA